jgi:hypothetical protein
MGYNIEFTGTKPTARGASNVQSQTKSDSFVTGGAQ